MNLTIRPRRLRGSETLRRLVRETRVDAASLIYPMFVTEGADKKEAIDAMPGQYRYGLDRMGEPLDELAEAGVGSVMLFGIPGRKDPVGSQAYADDGIVQRAVARAKQLHPEMLVVTDVCMCEYTSHGHCGVLREKRARPEVFPVSGGLMNRAAVGRQQEGCACDVDNDATLELLAKAALSHVRAGADMVAPSDMMDGRVRAIREALDADGYADRPIMSYAVKFASSFYGPFREAAGSAPSFGDRKSYQMDYHNRREALKEALLDVDEGADILMVKPAMAYLDLVRQVRDATNLPIATYSVSGEYAMVKAASANGWIDEEKIICEMAVAAFRAGADIYLTYFAKELARCIRQGRIG